MIIVCRPSALLYLDGGAKLSLLISEASDFARFSFSFTLARALGQWDVGCGVSALSRLIAQGRRFETSACLCLLRIYQRRGLTASSLRYMFATSKENVTRFWMRLHSDLGLPPSFVHHNDPGDTRNIFT